MDLFSNPTIDQIVKEVERKRRMVRKTFSLCRELESDEPDFSAEIYSIGSKMNHSLADLLEKRVTFK